MPFNYEFTRLLKDTPIADLSNCPHTRNAGSCTAASFLKEFTEGLPFIHLDIAGTASNEKNTRGKGVMIKSLFEYCASLQ